MRRWSRLILAALGLALGARPVPALEPGEVAVICNTKSQSSQALAHFYMSARKIPAENLIPVICSVGEDMSEEEYRKTLVPQIKKALSGHKGGTIKCLVTTYDVPLKIGPVVIDPQARQQVNAYTVELDGVFDQIDQQIGGLGQIAVASIPPASETQPATRPATVPAGNGAKRSLPEEVAKLKTAEKAAILRIGKLELLERAPALRQFTAIQQQIAGLAGVDAMIKSGGDSAQNRAESARLENQMRDIDGQVQDLAKDKDKPAIQKKLIELELLRHGLVGEAKMLDDLMNYLQPAETESCLDNELSLVLADQDYPKGRWLINPKNLDFYPAAQRSSKVPPTILVTRVDGLTVAAAEAMITTGLTVEKTGLDGTLYLDARGLHDGPYAAFDVQLRAAAKWLKENSTMPVVLDDKPELFQAKDCPNAALYCGWYSVHHYQDSCQWVKGAVGYHVASWEMVSLHNPDEKGWVTNLLKAGFCGTLGPTNEPYLASFPNPAYFFPLLESGEFTQGEVWEVTAPMLSWRTGFVGDPLYNPFKARPRVKVEALKKDPILSRAFAILRAGA